MGDDLPSEYDTIVIGTGMPECILAAAYARSGKSVLHLDRNEYYGGVWATFNFDGLEKWIKRHQTPESCSVSDDSFKDFLKEGADEIAIPCQYNNSVFTNVKCQSFIGDGNDDSDTAERISKLTFENQNKEEKVEEKDATPSQSTSAAEVEPKAEDMKALNEISDSWTMKKIRENYRKFNLDLAPKLLYSRGELVDLLISSNIARYAEFKSVSRVLTFLDGKLEQVPCSRADVFSTKNVSIVEKRMLMKLLTFCLNFEEHPNDYQDFENKAFSDFLKSRKLTRNVEHYVLNAIAMVPDNITTLEGLKATKRFLNSLGRYGNTPFLWPLYGSGELPQCFCRLCAVFGGIYYLKRSLEAVIIGSDNTCVGIVSDGKRLNCKNLVMEANFAPKKLLPEDYNIRKISRAILITDKSLLPAEKEQLTFLRLPPNDELRNPVCLVELGAASMACPADLFVVHLTMESLAEAESDLRPAIDLLFTTANSEAESGVHKPAILWCLYFNQSYGSSCDLQVHGYSNVYLTTGPNALIDLDNTVTEAKDLFRTAFPEEEFLPKTPDPEDIVIDDAPESAEQTGSEQLNPDSGVNEAESDEVCSDSLEGEGSRLQREE